MPHRPGFVLEVDRSTPPTLFFHGEGFRHEQLPVGSRVVVPTFSYAVRCGWAPFPVTGSGCRKC